MRLIWGFSPKLDLTFLLLPVLIAWALAMYVFPNDAIGIRPLWYVIIISFLIDNSHIFATLYRSVFDKAYFTRHKKFLITILVLILAGVSALFMASERLFWMLMAYAAMFHFARQQYGWLAWSYGRDYPGRRDALFQKLCIYIAALFPLSYCHSNLDFFFWFTRNDTLSIPPWITAALAPIYFLSIAYLLIHFITRYQKKAEINVFRSIVFFTTYLAWGFGPLVQNSLLGFAVMLVVMHGVPYYMFCYLYASSNRDSSTLRFKLTPFNFLLVCNLFGYGLAWLWYNSVFKGYEAFYPNYDPLREALGGFWLLTPLLATPILYHYVIDGFIWRLSRDDRQLHQFRDSYGGAASPVRNFELQTSRQPN